MYRGLGPTNTSRSNRSGRSIAASTPMTALTEWPTKTAGASSRASRISRTSAAYPSSRAYRTGSKAVRSEPPAPTWSKSTSRWLSAKAGATCRHMPWSQPNPCAKIIGDPSARPDRVTLFLVSTSTAATVIPAPDNRERPGRTGRGPAGRRDPSLGTRLERCCDQLAQLSGDHEEVGLDAVAREADEARALGGSCVGSRVDVRALDPDEVRAERAAGDRVVGRAVAHEPGRSRRCHLGVPGEERSEAAGHGGSPVAHATGVVRGHAGAARPEPA